LLDKEIHNSFFKKKDVREKGKKTRKMVRQRQPQKKLDKQSQKEDNEYDNMTVEQFLTMECEKQVQRINEHVEALVSRLKSEAQKQRQALTQLNNEPEDD
jgi:hypothetical protein